MRDCPGRGWWCRKSKDTNKPPMLPGMYENGAKKKGRFSALIDLKIAENAVFYLKVLNKIYS
jgi:hypothetical protein